MEKRYRLIHQGKGFLCEAPCTLEGQKTLMKIRKTVSACFKNARILVIRQAEPEKVETERVYKIGGSHGWKPEHCKEGFVKA